MRLLSGLVVVAVFAGLAGCGARPYPTYPDRTHFGFAPEDIPLRSDLNLWQIQCDVLPNGGLAVHASVVNEGRDIIATQELMSGDRGSFRVVATLTGADGATEVIEAPVFRAMPVTAVADVRLRGVRMPTAQITGIDVVADPDKVVPDPIRLNNRLQWKGTLDPASPQCTVAR
jgi:hypothetical protein